MDTRSRILLLFDNNGNEYVSRIQEGVSRAGRAAGVPVQAENLFHSKREIGEYIESIQSDPPGGIILTPPLSDDRHVLNLLEERGIPYVRIAPLLDTDRGSTVVMDEYDAARAITDLLLRKGHRRIGFVRGPNHHLVSMRRYNGYANALGGKGLRIDPSLIVQGDFSRESGRQQAPTLFAAKPTAIFASNDEMAAGVIDAAHAAGISVPRDISVVGFDDIAVARFFDPPLTTMRQPREEIGRMATRSLIDIIEGIAPEDEPIHVVLNSDLIVRESTRRAG